MFGFDVVDDELHLGGVPLRRLAERVGRTPFYAYERRSLDGRVAHIRKVLPDGVRLFYAVKANPMPALLSHLAPQVDGMDVASAGELKAALDAGCPAAQVCFAGPGKSVAELTQALAAGVLIHVESLREIDVLADLHRQHGWMPRIALRVNPDFEMRSAGMRMGGGAQVFGMDVEQVPQALSRMQAHGLPLEGFHVYSASQVLKADWLIQSWHHLADMLLALAPHLTAPIQSVNLGGGWGIPYFPQDQALDTSGFHEALSAVLAKLRHTWPDVQLIQELGRYLVGESGVYVSRVVDRKVSRGQVFLVLDGGMHQHLAASGNLGQVIRRPYPMAVAHRIGQTAEGTSHICGPLCTPLDALGHGIALPAAQVGDLIVVFQSGAYGPSASPQGFLSHPPCAEVLV